MAGLKEQARWENEIYQIEENDPVHGGENGITNKPTKQLANRTKYLKEQVEKFQVKTISAGQNANDFQTDGIYAFKSGATNLPSSGAWHLQVIGGDDFHWRRQIAYKAYSNEMWSRYQTDYNQEVWSRWERVDINALPSATITLRGLAQLTNDTGLDSESLALTAKAGKTLAQQNAQNALAINGKVGITNNEQITGEKTFSRQLKAFEGLRLANGNAGHYADFSADANTFWAVFKGKTFRWHNDGRFSIDNKKCYSELHKPSFADILQKPTTLDGYATRFNGVPYIQGSSGWTAIDFGVSQGNWRMEFNPNSHDANERRINFLYRNNGTDTYLRFPTIGTTGQTVAYQSWVDSRIQAIINASPSNLDTLKELADALGNDPNFSCTVINKVGQADTKATNAQAAANKAQTAANSANNNANGRVSKSGDTMTGDLIVPYLKATGGYISVSASNSSYAGIDIIRTGSSGAWKSRIEALPDKRWKFWVENSHEIHLPARGGTVALDHEKVNKSGDTMTGALEINAPDSFVRGKRGNAQKWYVGTRSSSSDDTLLHNYAYNYNIALQSDRIQTQRPIYIGSDRVLVESHVPSLFAGNLSEIGWCKLPNGLLLQWGSITVNLDSYATVNFPISFTTKAFNISLSQSAASGGTHEIGGGTGRAGEISIGNITKSNFRIANNHQASKVNWLAIGR